MNMILAMFSMPGMMEWAVIIIVGLLLFGRRLPDVGRSLGRTIVEFKKGIRGIEDDVDTSVHNRKPLTPPPPPADRPSEDRP